MALMSRPRQSSHLALTAGFVTAVSLCGCGSSSSRAVSSTAATPAPSAARSAATSSRVVPVVAGENFWGDIVRQIGGSHVTVTSIISDPNADPHTYETDPRDAAAISAATFVVLNGVGYDDFASKLLKASPNRSRVVLTIADADGVKGDNPNPHLWYDPVYVKGAAHAIEAQLVKADPADASVFSRNLATFLTAYQPYVDTIATIRAKHSGDKVAFTERVPGYLVDAAGLVLGTPASFAQSIEDGNDPSPADTAAIDTAMKSKSVKVLLYNAQVTSPTTQRVKDLAKAGGVPIVGVSETIPPDQSTFQGWQIAQAKAILAALGG